MGLDMYLLYPPEEGDKPLKEMSKDEIADFICDSSEAVYWRKANQIHRYLISHGKNLNILDWDVYLVNRKSLEKLIKTCQGILDHKLDPKEALPTMAGFFFGSTEYDEDYYQDLRDTVEKLRKFLGEDGENNEWIYFASW